MQTFTVNFNAGKSPAFKVATFQSQKEKRAYVDAETVDRACIEAYHQYQGARNLHERRTTGLALDAARWAFFKKWEQAQRSADGFDSPGVA